MKIKIDLADNFIDVWNEEKEIWERYVKIGLDEEKGLPEKLDYCEENTFMNKCKENSYLTREEMILLDGNFKFLCDKYNEIIDYLEKQSKGE